MNPSLPLFITGLIILSLGVKISMGISLSRAVQLTLITSAAIPAGWFLILAALAALKQP